MKALYYAGLGLITLGALMTAGILAFIPQCGFGLNLIIVSACLAPITVFGFNPNLVAGIILIAVGAFLYVKSHKETES